MTLSYLKSLNTGNIASGGSVTADWTPDSDVHIMRMYLSDRKKTDLAASQVWFEYGSGNVITKDYAPCSILGNSPLNALAIDTTVAKGAMITVKVTNGEDVTVNVDICFEVVK